MSIRSPTFAELWEAGTWLAIPSCPGRYKLLSDEHPPSLSALVGAAARFEEYRVSGARDVVVVVRLVDGGMISYRRPDGSYLHTLNTETGFDRKLAQLGITR